MFDKSTIEFLHSGCAVLIGTVDEQGQPHASRGWGLTVVDPDGVQLRVLADAGDAQLLANLRPGVLVAVTVAAVTTFASRQMKGKVVTLESATEDDEAKQRQYTLEFTRDIHEVDRMRMDALLRWADRSVLPFIVEIDSSFDQTPGPSAGSALATR
jgi:hypothetical protein